jgi:outer membrane immunogenic protein
VFTWTGFYVGVSGGGIRNDNEISTIGLLPGNIAAVTADARPSRLRFENDGFLVGGTVGFNLQVRNFVFGIEGDVSYTDADKTVVQFNPIQFGANAPGTLSNTLRQEMDYFATVRGRVGFALDSVLIYATGGAAIADVENTADFSSPRLGPTQFFGQRSETKVGYTVGGGFEFALPAGFLLGNAATFKTEYLYYDLGKTTVAVLPTATGVPAGVGGYVSRFENEGHIVRGGINFKFGTF